MAMQYYPALRNTLNDGVSGNAISDNITHAQGYVAQALENIAGLSTDWIFDDAIPDLVMPTIDWEELDPGGMISYFNTIYDKFMYPAINTTIDIEDVPELNVVDVPYTYDAEPLSTMATQIKADLAASAFGPVSADHTGLDARAVARAAMISGAMPDGMASVFGMPLPAAVTSAVSDAYARTGRSPVVSRDTDISYDAAWQAGKKMTVAVGLEVNRAIYHEFAIKIEAVLLVFNAKIDGYLKRIDAKSSVVGYEYEHYIARTKAYSAMVDAMERVTTLAERGLDTSVDIYRRRIQIAVSQVKETINKLMGIAEVHVGAGDAVFKANQGVAAGALSVMNVQASVSSEASETKSNSSGASATEALSVGENTSVEDNYTYEE